MTETPESPSESTRPGRLNQAAAAVGIVAGVVFIVAVVFFSGFFLGSHSAHRFSGPQVMRCEMGGSGEGMGGMGPGGMGPMGPGQPPSSTSAPPPAPSTPRP
ncbi:MAG: hypothetical protein QOG75_244 [Mycobacterium sp.]|jgi:hypothetical protein|nr:hypothetical protein [Mycobacterium sp.]